MSDWNVKVLPYAEWLILHRVIMRHPEGSQLSALDPSVQVLLEAKFLKQKGRLYYPTEAGIHHVMPHRLKPKSLLQARP